MTDKEHLEWIKNRIVNVYGEDPNTDFVLRLDEIIKKMSEAESVPASKKRDVIEVVGTIPTAPAPMQSDQDGDDANWCDWIASRLESGHKEVLGDANVSDLRRIAASLRSLPERAENIALRNCLRLAKNKARNPDSKGDWPDIIRFCEEAGVTLSPLRVQPIANNDEELREKIAHKIAVAWEFADESLRDQYRAKADAVLALLRSHNREEK